VQQQQPKVIFAIKNRRNKHMNEVKEGIFYRNGQIQFCRFSGRILTPTALAGQLCIAGDECSTSCPHFHPAKPDQKHITITCSGSDVTHDVDSITYVKDQKVQHLDLRGGRQWKHQNNIRSGSCEVIFVRSAAEEKFTKRSTSKYCSSFYIGVIHASKRLPRIWSIKSITLTLTKQRIFFSRSIGKAAKSHGEWISHHHLLELWRSKY
jgi:hypothetical protein